MSPSTEIADAVRRIVADECGAPPDSPRLSVTSWAPEGVARRQRRRGFVIVSIDEVPRYVAKIPLSEGDAKVVREFAHLQELRAASVPCTEPVCEAMGGFVMHYMPSQDMPDVVDADTSPEVWKRRVLEVIDATIDLHVRLDAVPSNGPPPPPTAVAACLAARLGATPRLEEAVRAAKVGPFHGDLGPWNVRVSQHDQRIRFLDWEDYRHGGLPALDILNLLFQLPLLARPHQRFVEHDQLYDDLVEKPGFMSDVIAAGLRRYASATRQSARLVAELLPLLCQYMIERIEADGRSADNLFFGTFRDRFSLGPPKWVNALDD